MTQRVRARCDAILRACEKAAGKSGVFAFNAASMARLLNDPHLTYSQARYALLELVERGGLTKKGAVYTWRKA